MKKNIFTVFVIVLFMFSVFSLKAQVLHNIPCSGFAWDVVADGSANSLTSTSRGVDSGGMVYLAPNFNPGSGICQTTNVWPAGNQINSLITNGLTYTLQAPDVNNVLLLTAGSSGTLTLNSNIAASVLYVLANAGNGLSTVIPTITFTDATTQAFSSMTVADWCSSASPPATGEFYRTGRNTSTSCNASLCQYMFEISLPISAANQNKMIASVSFFNVSGGRLCIYALGGSTSSNFQTITFPQIPLKLTTSAPFALQATASSGLPVSYTVVSGPATISNDSMVTVSGAGTVTIKAYQNGNVPIYDTAAAVINSFNVIDPSLIRPNVEARHPLAGNVYMPTLSKIQLAAISSINYAPLFSVQKLEFKINGQIIQAHDFGNAHYTAWWQPTAYGSYTIDIVSTSNYGVDSTVSVNINVNPTSVDTSVQTFSAVLLNTSISSNENSFQLPSFIGAYDTIIATLTLTCPTGGCGAWDRIANVEARSHEGNWFEIIRYITPYSTSCSHNISVNDYMSLLCGKVTFRINCTTYDNGYLYTLSFAYKSGTPLYKYSQVTQLWKGFYDFGNYANLQPVGIYNYTYPSDVQTSKIKLISTGHMGPNNSNNAAEFYETTHHIYINNVNTFSQHNWTNCNPNPDNCMPQNGTWQYNRAGWCPGAIARPFDYDMTSFIPTHNLAFKYVLYDQYIDQCNSHYPGCVSVTGSCDCADGANPFLFVDCNLINYFNNPPPDPLAQNINELKKDFGIAVFPNPSDGLFNLSSDTKPENKCNVSIYNIMGNIIKQFEWSGESIDIDLTNLASGVYFMKVSNKDGFEVKKLMLR
ncbi:MAG: T9SS type A sorting domain-containing protein [Bacteroidales bacterium]